MSDTATLRHGYVIWSSMSNRCLRDVGWTWTWVRSLADATVYDTEASAQHANSIGGSETSVVVPTDSTLLSGVR